MAENQPALTRRDVEVACEQLAYSAAHYRAKQPDNAVHAKALALKARRLDRAAAALRTILDPPPPPPTPALVALMRDYMERVADGRIITDTTTPEEARCWLEGRDA